MQHLLNEWQSAAPAAGAIIAFVSVVVAFLAFWNTRKANRRRATLDMVMKSLMDKSVQENYRKFRNLIRQSQSHDDNFCVLSLAMDDKLGTDDRNIITDQLNIYELMALGIRQKLFDEAFYKRWYHNQFMMDYEGVTSFISEFQSKKPSIYCESSALYRQWLKAGHPVSSPNRFKMAWWAFSRQHNKLDDARAIETAR